MRAKTEVFPSPYSEITPYISRTWSYFSRWQETTSLLRG